MFETVKNLQMSENLVTSRASWSECLRVMSPAVNSTTIVEVDQLFEFLIANGADETLRMPKRVFVGTYGAHYHLTVVKETTTLQQPSKLVIVLFTVHALKRFYSERHSKSVSPNSSKKNETTSQAH
jgi:hypothetical protein